jgi:hypothetical protein
LFQKIQILEEKISTLQSNVYKECNAMRCQAYALLNHAEVIESSTRQTTTLLLTELKSIITTHPVEAKAAIAPATPVIAPMPRLNPPSATATLGTGGQSPATEQAVKAETGPSYSTVVQKPHKLSTSLPLSDKSVPRTTNKKRRLSTGSHHLDKKAKVNESKIGEVAFVSDSTLKFLIEDSDTETFLMQQNYERNILLHRG